MTISKRLVQLILILSPESPETFSWSGANINHYPEVQNSSGALFRKAIQKGVSDRKRCRSLHGLLLIARVLQEQAFLRPNGHAEKGLFMVALLEGERYYKCGFMAGVYIAAKQISEAAGQNPNPSLRDR